MCRATLQSAIELLQCRSVLTVEDHLAKIQVPSLLIHGTLDVIAPQQHSQELARRLADCELHLMPGLGHVPILTAPAAVTRLIERRFDGVAVKAAA